VCKMKELDFSQFTELFADADEVCLVLRPKEGKIFFYGSKMELVRDWLSQRSMMGICAPLHDVQTDQLRQMLKWKEEGPPLGHPLSRERQLARLGLKRGLDYKATLLVMKVLLTSEIDGLGRKKRALGPQHLTPAGAKRAKTALDREWEQQKGEIPPRAPRGWWKD